MKRTFSFRTDPASGRHHGLGLVTAGTALIAVTYGLVRLAYGLYLPEIQVDLGFDAGTAGVISFAGSLAYVVGAVVGFVTAGVHYRGLVIAAGATAAVGTSGMALAPDVVPFAIAAVLSSVGAGLASPALVRILQRGLDDARQAGAQAIVNAGTGPGLVAAGVLGLVLLPQWRLAWLVAAGASVVAAGAVLALDGRVSTAGQAIGARGLLPPRSWYVAHRGVLCAASTAGAASAGVWNFGRTLLVEAGLPGQVSVGAWISLGIGGAAVIATAGRLSRWRPRTVWALTAAVMAAATAALVAAPGVVPLAFAACAAFGWAYTAATGALIAWTVEIDPTRAASGTALLFVVLVLGQAVGAVAVGSLVQAAGYDVAFGSAACVALASAAPALRRTRRRTVAA